MKHQEILAYGTMRPINTPRTSMSEYIKEVEQNKTNLAINIDKSTLLLFRDKFEDYGNTMTLLQFVASGMKIMGSWQNDLTNRQMKLCKYLMSLFNEIVGIEEEKLKPKDSNPSNTKKGVNGNEFATITWEQFNNLIIQKALNLKSLQFHEAELVSLLKQSPWSRGKSKLMTPIQKILCIDSQKKMAYMCEQSDRIQFIGLQGHNPQVFRPLILDKHDIKVEKSLVKRVKEEGTKKKMAPKKQIYKKDIVVSAFRVTFLDMLYLEGEKYQMLLTSSSDGIVRGWDIRGSTPTLARQPENEDEKMLHHFSTQIHCMAWDDINEILYCSGKDEKIYLWLIKTDSQRELTDPDGHTGMISCLIMMPKLQFLATGGYDGKLILWDTISLNKKFKYEEHTRSIISMTFHDALILLFTASFDHSICVWNPYIPSLIYKIACNINVVQISIIPKTNYLAALDSSSTIKIREVNKFNLVSSFVVDRPDDNEFSKVEDEMDDQGKNIHSEGVTKIEPTCMGLSQSLSHIFFGGHSIKCMEFDENQILKASEFYPTKLRYVSEKKRMFVSIKNNILVWDMLTGELIDTLSRQTEQEITAFDLIDSSGNFVIGDSEGCITLRKQDSGIKVSKLYQNKYKAPVTHIVSRQGGFWNPSVIIGCCQDCEIPIFGKDESNDYAHLRTLNPRKSYPKVSIQVLEYEIRRNILIIGTHSGDIIFMDVDKNKVTNLIQTHSSSEILYFKINYKVLNVLILNKNNEVFGVFLPPHSKKFKPSCSFELQPKIVDQQKISTAVVGEQCLTCFIGYENGGISKFNIPDDLLSKFEGTEFNRSDGKLDRGGIQEEWSIYFQDSVKDILLIQKQRILIVILNMKNIAIVSAEEGDILNILPSHAFIGSHSAAPFIKSEPLGYYNQETMQIYTPINKKTYNMFEDEDQKAPDLKQMSLRLSHDPFYLYEVYKKVLKREERIAREKQQEAQRVLQEEQQKFRSQRQLTQKKIESQPINIEKNSRKSITSKSSVKTIQLKKEKEEKLEQKLLVEKIQKVYNPKIWNIEPFFQEIVESNLQKISKISAEIIQFQELPKKRSIRNNTTNDIVLGKTSTFEKAYGVQKKWEKIKQELDEQGIKTKTKNFGLTTVHENLNKKHSESIQNTMTRHQSLHKHESSPMFRLGLALIRIDDRDQKAIKFLQLAQKQKNSQSVKNSLKLPKISKPTKF